ncbi:glutathione S-transferase (plasmid) [Burkholderia sp. THE68]|uniref:glutathione S-transferase family protein n=1 Tax=Burkholderiaceae TaxID=119060 RepID=UPI0013172911|nr:MULTISPECIES: glutathione S-transferase family protein [Burkholderiaceae]BBU32694.1 glutathione S-transferase [Burkholderia sp. THE68]BCQ26944.1 glutathione S-transferase N-terminal domain-containing protein [Caballeronia sp. NK8]
MITLHHCVSARSFRPLWALEEIGVPYELKMLPFPPRVLAHAFKEVNPLGTIPLLEDGALLMTESAAICQYLAARHSPGVLDVAPHEADFGRYLNFVHFGEATLTFPQTLVLRYTHLEPPERRQPQIVDDYARWFHARLRTLAPLLAAQPFLCAGRFTAADISVGYALMLAELIDLNERFAPSIADYWSRLRERDGFIRAMRAQEAAALAQNVPTIPSPKLRP